VPNKSARPCNAVAGLRESINNPTNPDISLIESRYQIAIGPMKNNDPFISSCVFLCSGKNNIAIQKGPTHIVDKKKEMS